MNCIIIDDEATSRTIIGELCSSYKNLNVVEVFSNAIEAIKYLNQNKTDLIFLDIHMPDFNGFDFIRTLKDPPYIILTTADAEFAIQAFEYDCIVDYIVKPIKPERFKKSIQKVEGKLNEKVTATVTDKEKQQTGDDFYVNINKRLIKIDIQSIYLVEAKGDYIYLKTDNKNYTVHSTLKKIEEKLPDHMFLKIHRSYIININKIIDIEDNSVLIEKDVVPVSRSNRPELMKRLNLL
ncbi:LytTR family DNA-binding domain-containing protein [bacterium]|jgi:two-component system response regulator LytT|nr:LytTR family DNA-binding domain-containing protein [bacterium]MDA9906789.1 LytTR family DNA-binding domain-containing protein [Flavobacteriaceae bacterium]